jgi:uncharacterized membrane protein YcaP (DUF421 family)
MEPSWGILSDRIDGLIGLHADPAHLTLTQMGVRVLIIFLWGVALVRIVDRRRLGRNAGFDVLRCRISADDLDENLRLHGNVAGSGGVREARLERNGTISVVKNGGG